MNPHQWNHAKKHLRDACPTMKRIIDAYPGEGMKAREDGFYTLLRAIVGQQISVKAADSIWKRLEAKVKPLTPEKLNRTRITTLRSIGLSEQKAHYAKNVARFWVERGIIPPQHPGPLPSPLPQAGEGTSVARGEGSYWQQFSNEEVIRQLTSIKGIGRWTAEMFLIFHVARPDVLPLGDLGLLKAIDRHYPAKHVRKKGHYEQVAEAWRPYRSMATWYLWRSLDPVPVAY